MCDELDKFERTADEQKSCEKEYDSFRNELLKRELSNSENYDKTIISLSSAGLAISLTALNSVIPFSAAKYMCLIRLTWFFFLLTIMTALSAYVISNKAINRQLQIAEDYYIHGLNSAATQKNIYSIINSCLNIIVGVLFVVAMIFMVSFVYLNFKE